MPEATQGEGAQVMATTPEQQGRPVPIHASGPRPEPWTCPGCGAAANSDGKTGCKCATSLISRRSDGSDRPKGVPLAHPLPWDLLEANDLEERAATLRRKIARAMPRNS